MGERTTVSQGDPSTPDGEIVAAVLEGDRERFAEIVRRYYRPLVRVAQSRIGRSEAAEDIVQESFLCALKSLHTYNSAYSFRTWLWTITLNQCRRHYAKNVKRQVTTDQNMDPSGAVEQVDDRYADPLTRVLSNERREQLEQLLADLSNVQADALRLRFFGHLKFQEIADTMKCSLSTAKHRVRSGLRQMSRAINGSDRGNPHNVETQNEL